MKLLLTIICALVLAVLVGVFASRSSGVLLLTFGDWTIQTSTTFFIALCVFSFVLLYLVIRLVVRLIRIPREYRNYRDKKDLIRADNYLVNGMLAMIEGKWQAAEKAFEKGSRYTRAPQLNYIGAARAAQKQGKIERRDDFLRLAHQHAKEESAAAGIAQAQLLLEQKQIEQALAVLTDLDKRFPDQLEVKYMLLDLHTRLKDWNSVIRLLKDLKNKKRVDSDRIRSQQLQAYAGQLQQAGNSGDDMILARTWITIPKQFRREVFLIQAYVLQRIRFRDHFDAEIQVRNVLKKQWDETLVRLYGFVRGHDPMQQLEFAEDLLHRHSREPVLLMTLGRLCLRNKLWGKARMYFEECLSIKPSPELYRELAGLLEKLGEKERAAKCYQKGLQLATEQESPRFLPANDSVDGKLE
ncbi:MAG: heme biosynthesis HemY N-terminal domain-containing protein [Gammaproteobacteria bacterium]|nr:heme biosynthesis HemY N-terminal domain-containing protein [Gammaproteobacteria bacterium]